MKLDWNKYMGQTLNVTMNENYGVVYGNDPDKHPTFYEIVFKTGKLVAAFDDAILLEATRDKQIYNIYVPYNSIKCVEIF